MPQQREPELSLAEWLVLCLVGERPTHGFAIAGLLAEDGSLGRIWHVRKAVVYRAVQRLEMTEPGCDPDERRTAPMHGVSQTHAVPSRAKAHVLLHTPTVQLSPGDSEPRRGEPRFVLTAAAGSLPADGR
jgi:hypothetical protein